MEKEHVPRETLQSVHAILPADIVIMTGTLIVSTDEVFSVCWPWCYTLHWYFVCNQSNSLINYVFCFLFLFLNCPVYRQDMEVER